MSYNSEEMQRRAVKCQWARESVSLRSCININDGQEEGQAVNNNLQKWTNNIWHPCIKVDAGWIYSSDLVTSSFCSISQNTPTPTEPSFPHCIPVEAILIHIACSLRPHFSFPLRIEADTRGWRTVGRDSRVHTRALDLLTDGRTDLAAHLCPRVSALLMVFRLDVSHKSINYCK